MTRAHRSYTDRTALTRTFEGADVSEPVAGFYRGRLVSDGVIGGIRLWYGPPKDPVTGEEMDRSHRWQAEFDGAYVEFDRVWPLCAGSPISEADYRALVARREWAKKNSPDSAYADPTKKIDRLSTNTPLLF